MNNVHLFNCEKLRAICDPSAKSLIGQWKEGISFDELSFYVENKIVALKHEAAIGNSVFRQTYHLARIAYFVIYGWNDAIKLKFGRVEPDYWPDWTVVDGNHRFVAALYRKNPNILGEIIDIEEGFDFSCYLDSSK